MRIIQIFIFNNRFIFSCNYEIYIKLLFFFQHLHRASLQRTLEAFTNECKALNYPIQDILEPERNVTTSNAGTTLVSENTFKELLHAFDAICQDAFFEVFRLSTLHNFGLILGK